MPRVIAEAFGPKALRTAQYDMPVEDFAAMFAELKPKFIHHPEPKERIKALLGSFRCDLDRDYFDVPACVHRRPTTIGYRASRTRFTRIVTRGNWPLSRYTVGAIITRHVTTAAVTCTTLPAKRITPHTLRHTNAMLLRANNGASHR
jgi:hypothetical protein